MKIHQLFEELKVITQDKEKVFADSGITNCYHKMQYGFFPLGLGILDENNKEGGLIPTEEIEEGGIMVLGNDFGTVKYVEQVKNYGSGIGEINSPTINNLLKLVPMINKNKAFFTNFYLGIRLDDGLYDGTTMTKRIYDGKLNKIGSKYKETCGEFFKIQLAVLKPKMVICLGHEVKKALIDSGPKFHQWKPKSESLEKLYSKNGNKFIIEDAAELGGTKFIIIPHPCYSVNLLKPPYINKLNDFLGESIIFNS